MMFKILTVFLVASVASISAQDLISQLWVQTSACTDCGMTSAGSLAFKVCGSLACCYSGFLGGRYPEGSQNIYSGPQLGECDLFDVGLLGTQAETMAVTLYHTGTDGGRFDYVNVATQNNHRFECTVNATFMDGNSFLPTNPCTIIF